MSPATTSSHKASRSAVVITVGGLGARWLAPWGCGSVLTPAINRLAARSVVYDHALALTGSATSQFAAWQSGSDGRDLAASVLLTDCGHAAASGERCFADVIELQPASVASLAEDEAATHLAGFFAGAAELLQTVPVQGSLVWIHSAGLELPWDAPLDWRMAAQGEGDPGPPETAGPPEFSWDPATEPDRDLVTGWQQALSAQIRLIDFALQPLLLSLLDAAVPDPPLVILAGASGFGLGEHARIGRSGPGLLHDEFLHVPLVVHVPRAGLELVRTQQLTDVGSLVPLVNRWFAGEHFPDVTTFPALPDHSHQVVWCQSGSARMIRTGAWKLIETPGSCQLFLKPDDRWEQNDVANRCPEVVELLRAQLDRLADAPQGLVCLPESDAPLPEVLVRGVE